MSTGNYSEEFMQPGCDMSEDKQHLHPSKLCNKHKALLLRDRTAETKGLEFRTSAEIFQFLLNT